MLSFFRRLTQSRIGVIVTFVVLGVIAIAFAATDITGLQSGAQGGVTGGNVASVGGTEIGAAELREAAAREIDALRQRQPGFDAAQFMSAGGLDRALEGLVNTVALERFGQEAGMVVSKRYVDGQIASIPALQGPTGKFDQSLYERILADRRITDAQIREDIAREAIGQQLVFPTIGASQVPQQLALPYASLLLERRTGSVGFVPNAAVPAGTAPSDAEIQAFYTRNRTRYALPPRRTARYALVTPDVVRAAATPSDAEIAQSYNANRARYAATERRTVTQVVLADQAAATALAARVRGGTTIAAAARAAGLEPSTQSDVDKAGYAAATAPALADAAFGATQGALVGPVRTPLGWTVARVDAVRQVPGRSLAQVREEIAAALRTEKTQDALGRVHDAIDDALGESATFDEVVADQKLAARTTPAVTATGADPVNPNARLDPALAPVVAAAFQAEEGDAPQLVQTAADGSFALVAVGRALPAAPRPLSEIRETVARDFAADRARQLSRRAAASALAKANNGTPLARALTETGLRLPAPRPLSVPRSQIAANPRGVEPTLALLFSMAPGTTKLLEAPDRDGWYLVRLDRIDRGNATGRAQLIDATRADLGRVVGREYTEQFVRAVRAQVGVAQDSTAVARVRADLTGQSAGR